MFDDIGTYRDTEMGERRVLASVGTAGLLATAVLALLVASTVEAPAQPLLPDEPMGEFPTLDDPVELTLGGMEAPEPPAQGAADPEPTPAEPDEPVQLPVEAVQAQTTPPLTPPEQAPGVAEGTGTAPTAMPGARTGGTGTTPGGTCVGEGCDGEGTGTESGDGGRGAGSRPAKLKPIVTPPYPPDAAQLNLGDERCVLRITVDDQGRPQDVQVSGCHPAFVGPAKKAALTWRWYPAKHRGQRVGTVVTAGITYRLSDR